MGHGRRREGAKGSKHQARLRVALRCAVVRSRVLVFQRCAGLSAGEKSTTAGSLRLALTVRHLGGLQRDACSAAVAPRCWRPIGCGRPAHDAVLQVMAVAQ